MVAGIIKKILNNISRENVQRVVHLVMPVAALFYAGKAKRCPVCERGFRKMLPYGYVVARDNALCPGCLSLERHRLMWLFLQQQTNFFTAQPRLLHIAPERCFIKRFEQLLGDRYTTADLCSPLAKVKMDVQAIPFGDGQFDVVLCNHILEHVENDRLAMSEMFRVMRSGGWGIMLSPVNYNRALTYEDSSIVDEQDRERAFGQRDHVREYGRDYADRLREAGFVVDEIDYIKELSVEQVQSAAVRGEIIYLVKKP